MDIEEVARSHPEKILTFSIDPATGIMPHHGRRVAQELALHDDLAKQAQDLVSKLYAAFVAKDMSLLEVNPLVLSKTGQLVSLHAKAAFDANALYRHPDIVALRDLTEEDEKEIEASKYDLNYVALDGTIGCMVNGPGPAMATLELVNLFGGIMKCDVIAEGVVAAVKEVGLRVPLVVRLEGTNVELGKDIIAKSNLNVTSADDLDDAAQKIVKAVNGG